MHSLQTPSQAQKEQERPQGEPAGTPMLGSTTARAAALFGDDGLYEGRYTAVRGFVARHVLRFERPGDRGDGWIQ